MTIDFKNKTALVRVDFNVPLDKKSFKITDDTRIRAALPTIKKILKDGGAAILMSHLGRPGKKLKEDGSINVERFTLEHVVKHVAKLLKTKVHFCPVTVGKQAQKMVKELPFGEVLIIENTRFQPEEKKGDEAFAKQLAKLGDVYINDAFGTAHRAHASTTTVAKYFKKDQKAFGYLMEKEIENANRVLHDPKRPLTAIIGGAKVSDKILLLEKLIDFADNIIVGGGMAYTFLKAQGGKIGQSLCEDDRMKLANKLVEKAKKKGVKLLLPKDSITADDFNNNANIKTKYSKRIPKGWMGLDIGEKAVEDFSTVIKKSETILWNGPMGVFEMTNFANGTKAIALAVAAATKKGAFSLVGGGDSVAAVSQMKLDDDVSYVSTGGGAMLEFLEGKELPAIAAMK